MRVASLLALLALAGGASAEVVLTEGTNISVDVSSDGRAAIDLLGGLWIMPAGGGLARAIEDGPRPAHRPRWSPDASALVYQASGTERDELWLHHLDTGSSERLGNGGHFNQHPSWHPGNERVVFSSDRRDSGFDIWEIDLATRLSWRLTSLPGDESEPAWSEDGRSLIYIHELDGVWSLMLRRHGKPDTVVVSAEQRIAAPSWRPDGSLITYMLSSSDGWSVRMAILSDPILDRPIIEGEDFFLSPVAWLNRQQMFYAANGKVRKRRFNSWTSANVPFRVEVGSAEDAVDARPTPRDLPAIDVPDGTTVIRAARYFDGLSNDYADGADIVIENGRIAAIEASRDREGTIVIDLGDVTILPGLIDAYASLPADVDATLGPLLLGLGVTTIVANPDNVDALNTIWSGKAVPGPRVISSATIPNLDNWQIGFGTRSMPTSPAGRSYQDAQLVRGAAATTFVSGLADSNTPGLGTVLNARLAREMQESVAVMRRFSQQPDLSSLRTTVVLGSAPNQLPPGIAQQAELRALVAAGLNGEQALKAAGVNAAAALGLGTQVGRLAPGALADFLLVDGDPLGDINDALKILGVVRNGRFFSVSGLVDRAMQAKTANIVE